jgi:hypothetical protein
MKLSPLIIDIRNRKTTRFTFKALIFCIESLSIKKVQGNKSSEDINAGESVSMNVAPLYF